MWWAHLTSLTQWFHFVYIPLQSVVTHFHWLQPNSLFFLLLAQTHTKQNAMTQTEPPLDSVPSAPSFSYLADIATGVIQELRTDSNDNDNDNDNHDFNFEFSFVPRNPVSADDIFYNGQIRPIYPLFNQNAVVYAETTEPVARPRRLPLRELMFEERDKVNDKNNDLDGVAEGTYCVWTPPCKKTNSSSPKRWTLRNLLPRSHSSDGKRSRTSKVAPKHSSAKFVSFFSNANGFGRNLQPFSKAS